MIQKNVDQARYLAALVQRTDHLELLAPVPLNIVCFRYCRPGCRETDLNDLNRQILVAIHERGIAVPSYTMIDDRVALRCAVTNHRSRTEDFDVLVTAVLSIGDALSGLPQAAN